MLTYHTLCDNSHKVVPVSGFAFFSVFYLRSNGHIKWLCSNRRLSFIPSSAARFSSFEDAKAFAGIDFSSGRCQIVLFIWSITSSCYWSFHSYSCIGGLSESDCFAGRFCI